MEKLNGKRNKMYTALWLILIVFVIVLSQNNFIFSKTPIIQWIEPEKVYFEYPDTWNVSLHGSAFCSDMQVYVNGNELEEFEYIDEENITINIPESIVVSEELHIMLRGKNGRYSNEYLTTVAHIDRPIINSADIIEDNKAYIIYSLSVENIPASFVIEINGIEQDARVFSEDGNIVVKVSTPLLIHQNDLEFKIKDLNNEEIYSEAFVVSNTHFRNNDEKFQSNTEWMKKGFLVAHAFGALDGVAYTSSLEAFNDNYKKGHRIFEVDFQLSEDGKLFTLHDRAERIGTFEEEQSKVEYTLMTFEEVCDLLIEYPDIYIITDTKYFDNYSAIGATFDVMKEIIERKDSSLYNRIIVQFYNQPMYYFMIDNYDFKSYIYTLYQSEDTQEDVISFVEHEEIKAVTMPYQSAKDTYVQKLNDAGCCVFVHTLNDVVEANSQLGNGVFGIYTDTITYDDLKTSAEERYLEWEKLYVPQIDSSQFDNPIIARNYSDFINFLTSICKAKDEYLILVSGQDDVSYSMTDDIQTCLEGLGITTELKDKGRYSFAMVVDGGTLIYEDCSQDKIEKDLLVDGVTIHLVSAGYDVGNTSEIVIDGIEYSRQCVGLNFVLYHKESRSVVETVSFNTCEGYWKN